MKNSSLRKGFTLVEIMIVVVIIGLLAALAIPAFKKVRNNAIEKSIINDARQISSAAQQYCSENADTQVNGTTIAKYLNGGSFSSGVRINSGAVAGTLTAGGAYTLSIDGTAAYFTLSHPQFDANISSNAKIVTPAGTLQTGAPDTHSVVFNTVDGQIK